MKVKFEIEKKIEDDNGKKTEKETTVTFDDVLDIKKKAKSVGAFLVKQAKKTAEIATDIAAEIAYNVAATTANVLDSVADTADTVVNSIDRFLDKNYEVVEEEDTCDEQCCGEACEDDIDEDGDDKREKIDELIDMFLNYLCGNSEDESCDEASDTENDEPSEDAEVEESPVTIFLKGVIGDIKNASENIIAIVKAGEEKKAAHFEEVDNCMDKLSEMMEKYFGVKIEKSEKTSEDEETADEEEIEKVSDDTSETDTSDDEIEPNKSFAEKIAEIPEGKKFTLSEYLDYLGVYKCEEKVVDPEREACIFFAAIGYPATYASRVAFENAATLEHINYNSVSDKVGEKIPNMSKEEIIEQLKADFDKWLETHEDVKMYCPKPTFRFLLKYFVKKIRLS